MKYFRHQRQLSPIMMQCSLELFHNIFYIQDRQKYFSSFSLV